jgi:tight adherence protein C
MTFLLVLIAVSLFGAGAVLVVRAVAIGRVRVSGTMRNISAYGTVLGESPAVADSPGTGPLAALADRLGRAVPFGALETRMLRAAGMYNMPRERFQGYRVLLAGAAPLLLVMVASVGGSVSAKTVLLALVASLSVWLLAPAGVRSRGQRRLDHIDRSLPQLIDVLGATVEGGLGLGSALQLVSGRFEGPLGQELRVMLHEQSMGLSAERALQNLLDRCDTPSVRSFVRATTQGEALGVSIGQTLRNLAAETRKRRRQLAEEKMMKAPVKMLFPLVLLMLPALFIILMYPALHNVVQAFGTH